MTEKINDTKSWFFEKTHPIEKALANVTKTREETQITKVRNQRGGITIELKEIKRTLIL